MQMQMQMRPNLCTYIHNHEHTELLAASKFRGSRPLMTHDKS